MTEISSPLILVVDDEPLLANLNKRLLEKVGYRVDVVTESRLAMKMIADSPQKYDLLITDFAMPGASGAELVDFALGVSSKLPIIIFTGAMEKATKDQMIQRGVKKVIIKPVLGKELQKAAQAILEG